LAFSGYKAREDEESQGEELGKTGGNWTRKLEVKKSKAGGRKKPRTGGAGAKSREKTPENRGRQSTNFIYHRRRLSLSKHIETENWREHRRPIKYQKHGN